MAPTFADEYKHVSVPRYNVALNALSATFAHPSHESITYLDQSKIYSLSIMDLAVNYQWHSQPRYQTLVQVLFEPGEAAAKHYARLRSWTKHNHSMSSASSKRLKPAIEYIPYSGNGESLQVEIEAASFDSVLLKWTLNPVTQDSFCMISIRFNSFPTDFSSSESAAGKRMMIFTKTQRMLASDTGGLSMAHGEESCLYVHLVFNSGVAERRLYYILLQARREEEERRGSSEYETGRKRMDCTSLEAMRKDQGYKDMLGSYVEATYDTKTMEGRGKDPFAQDNSYQLRPVSLFRYAVQPGDQCAAVEQPDVDRIAQSIGSDVLSDPYSLISVASKETFILPKVNHHANQNRVTADLVSSAIMRDEKINLELSCAGCDEPVICFNVRSEDLGSAHHHAIYLNERTIEALVEGICVKFQAQPEMVQQITYFDINQVQVLVDRNNVAYLPDGLYMIVQLDFAQQFVSYSSLQSEITSTDFSPTDSGSTFSTRAPFTSVGIPSLSDAEYTPDHSMSLGVNHTYQNMIMEIKMPRSLSPGAEWVDDTSGLTSGTDSAHQNYEWCKADTEKFFETADRLLLHELPTSPMLSQMA